MQKPKILRVTTVAIYMNIVLRGQFEALKEQFDIVAVTKFDSKHFDEVKNITGVKLYAIDLKRTISLFYDFKALFQLIGIIIKERPNIVHSHTPKAGLITMLAGFICRVPIRMHTITGMPLMGAKGFKRRLLFYIDKLIYRMATHVYPNSHGLQEILIQNELCKRHKLKVLGNGSTNGIDTFFFNSKKLPSKEIIRDEFRIPNDAFVFLFVGRIAKEKGVEELVTSVIHLEKTLPNLKPFLILVGAFEKENGLVSSKIQNAILQSKNIIHLGRFDDVRPFYKAADVFVLPSYREGFPNAVLEAGAMGIPCIVTDINGCNEIINSEHYGEVIPIKNQVALQESMYKFLIMHNNHFIEIKEKIRDSIMERFERKKIHNIIIKEYFDLLNSIKKK